MSAEQLKIIRLAIEVAYEPHITTRKQALAALNGLEEQLEAARQALREIASYTASENIADRYGRFVNDRLQEIALLALAESNPAKEPN